MNPQQIYKMFYERNSYKEAFYNSIPNAVHNENNKYLPWETFKAIEALPPENKTTVYKNHLKWIKNYSIANAETLKSTYRDQSRFFNEKTCNDMLSYMKRNMPEIEAPFEKFTHLSDEEKARRKALQQKAFDLYLDKANEDQSALMFTASFTSISRPTQQVFRPDDLKEESIEKSLEELRLLTSVKEASALHKNGEPFTEQELNDRKNLAKIFEDKMKAAFNGVFDANASKTDEEFLDKSVNQYHFCQLLVQAGRSGLSDFLKDTGLTENDLSPDFIDYYNENSQLAVTEGSLLQNRLSTIANPLYSEVEPEEWNKFYDKLSILQDGSHDNILQPFRDTFSKPGIKVPATDEIGELNYLKGYSDATFFTSQERSIKESGFSLLGYYAQKYMGVSDFKECNVIDENGILIKEEDIFMDKLMKGESINILLKDARYMLPIKVDKWGTPIMSEIIQSPFYQRIMDSAKGFMRMNEKLPANLKLNFGDDIWKSEEEKIVETFKKNFSDPEKVRLHIRAREFAKLETFQGSSNKTTKDRIIKDGFFQKEDNRLKQKFGEIPLKDDYFRRALPYFYKTDNSKESKEYNEMLYKSCLMGTDDAKKILEKGIKKVFSLNFKEIQEALKSDKATLDFYEKHYSELRIAFDMNNLVKDNKIFTPEFEEYALKNVDKMVSAAGALQIKVMMMSEPPYMADVYNQPLYQNGDYDEHLGEFISSKNKNVGQDMNGNMIGFSEYNILRYKENFPIYEKDIDAYAKKEQAPDFDMNKKIVQTKGRNHWFGEEYVYLFQKEICEKGINGKKYSTISDFLSKNRGNIFNIKFKKDSDQYKNLVKALDTFIGKLKGEKEAFPPNRRNNPGMNKSDFIEIKEFFDKYIDHKNEELKRDKKEAFSKNSTSDNRYKFAKKMSEILGKVIRFEPINLDRESNRNHSHKIIGEIIENKANNGKGFDVDEQMFEDLNNSNIYMNNIVNEESDYFIDGLLKKDETASVQDLLSNNFNKDKVKQTGEKSGNEKQVRNNLAKKNDIKNINDKTF